MNVETTIGEILWSLQKNRKDRKIADPLEDKLVQLIQGMRGDLGVMMRGIRNCNLLQNHQREKRMFFELDHVKYLNNFVLLCKEIAYSHNALNRIKVVTELGISSDDALAISRLIFDVAEEICRQEMQQQDEDPLGFRYKISILLEAYCAISYNDE